MALTKEKQQFLDYLVQAAVRTENKLLIPAEVTVLQGIHESGWGSSKLAREGKNLYGIKDQAKDSWTGPFILMKGWEILKGKRVEAVMKWRKYETWDASTEDHAQFFYANKRYAKAIGWAKSIANVRAGSFHQTVIEKGEAPVLWLDFAKAIHEAGYATDPKYVDKLIAIDQAYGITKLCQAERRRLKRSEAAKVLQTARVQKEKDMPPTKPQHWAAPAAQELAKLGIIKDPDPSKLAEPMDRGTVFALLLAILKFLGKA